MSAIGAVLVFYQIDQFYVSVILHLSMSVVYFGYAVFVFWAIDTYFNKRKYFAYLVLYLSSSCLTAFLCTLIESGDPPKVGFSGNLIGVFFLSGFAVILRYARQKIGRRVELQEYKEALQEAEIKLLKEQLNPHFLFNTLNNIQYHCLVDPPKASEMLMQLSDLLRYQLDSVRSGDVKLDEELRFISHYIEFEKRRIPDNVQLEYKTEIEESEYFISPGIIITLVENAFKHFYRDTPFPYIHISLSRKKNVLAIRTENSFLPGNRNYQGASMMNLRKRLDFIYGDRYTLNITERDHQVSIDLTITL